MTLKNNLIRLAVLMILTTSFFYIINFTSHEKNALANINNKETVEVFKTPSWGCWNG